MKNTFKENIFGFTLVELLGVIIILGVIALITYPIIDKSIKNSKEESLKQVISSIEEAAYNYSVENDLGYDEEQNKIELTELIKKGYLNLNIINPVTNETMDGCVIYNWVESKKQYEFTYDEECEIIEQPPEIRIIYDEKLINENGWGKDDLAVTISGIGELKYCLSNNECEPNQVIEKGNNTKFVTTEGINYICAIASNSLGTSEKKCIEYKLDKTRPNISGIEDKVIKKSELINLKENVTYSDSLSGISGNLMIEPSSIDTSISGTKSVKYSIRDNAGNIREVVRRIIVDSEAPTIVYNVTEGTINANGWANKNFYVTATITDNSGSGIKSAKSCVSNSSSECVPIANITGTTKDFYIEVEGNNRTCIEVTDNNNKTTKLCSDTYKLDKTTPIISTNDSEFELIKGTTKLVKDYFSISYGISGGNLSCNYEYVPSSQLKNVELKCTATSNSGLTSTKTKIIEIVADEKLRPDGIPDKYQALITFSVNNGRFVDGTAVHQILVNLYDDNNKLSENGYYILTDDDIPVVDNTVVSCDDDRLIGAKVTADIEYMITCTATPVTPVTPVLPSP